MALVQYVKEPNIRITKRMGAPQKATIQAWYKACRKMIPQIPELCAWYNNDIERCGNFPTTPENHWHFQCEPDISVKWIKFTLANALGERCHIIIDRSQPAIGAA